MPIRDIGSNYRNKIKTLMDDIADILSALNEGDYIKITYPSDKKIIYMRLDKINPIDSSFYNMQTYTGIIDLSFQGPAYLYTYDEYENPVSLDCYNEYLLSNSINRNTAIATDDPDTMEIINATIFHDDFITLFNKFYFNGYTWPPAADMPDHGTQYPKNYAMAVYSYHNAQLDISGLPIPNTREMKIDIIFQVPTHNTYIEKPYCCPFELTRPGIQLYTNPNKNFRWNYVSEYGSTEWDYSKVCDGNNIPYENKFHMVFDIAVNTKGNTYVYMEELRTGQSYEKVIEYSIAEPETIDLRGVLFNNANTDGTIAVGIERFRIWCEDNLLMDLVPLAYEAYDEPLFLNLVNGDRYKAKQGLPEIW